MIWRYEDETTPTVEIDETRMGVRIRRNRQVSIPKLIIEQIEKFLPVSTNGRFYNFDIVLDVKAIHINSDMWYRILPKGATRKEEIN